ncbi:hypothetical protein VE04_05157 [Pseudogymnoascus sp. 24MN13]|nr:hypothetical protein VE04_05157 [Pseudogymnoascus sp. 24MN13]
MPIYQLGPLSQSAPWTQLYSSPSTPSHTAPVIFPPPRGVLWLTLSWVAWIVPTVVLFNWATPVTRTAIVCIWVPFFLVLVLLLFGFDKNIPCADRIAKLPKKFLRGHQYNYNLGNTVLTLSISALVLPWLYYKFWYPNRTKSVIISDQDTVDSVYFPSLTLFQRADWTSQANLDVSVPGKCFLGWYDESAPDCSDVEPGVTPCQCAGSWDEKVTDFQWHNTSYRALTLTSNSSMMSKVPTTQMIAQAFFNCKSYQNPHDSSKALSDSSMLLSPSLWIAIYDPTLDLASALENGYTRMVLINANGVTAINLGLNRRQAPNTSPAYDYKLSVSTIPAARVNCGATSTGSTAPCHISLFLQFPSFDRQNSRLGVEMKWEEVVAAAGSWFSLFQIAGWIFSGLAFHTG